MHFSETSFFIIELMNFQQGKTKTYIHMDR